MKDNAQFIWSCTKFLAFILCVLSSAVWWIIGFVILGYIAIVLGLLFALLTYVTEISPVLKQQNSENKD